RLWEVESGKLLRSLREQTWSLTTLSWSPDGKSLASGDALGSVQLWEADTGQPLRSFSAASLIGGMVWLPDGKTLAIGGGDCTVRLVDPHTGRSLGTLVAVRDKGSWAISPEGHYRGASGIDHCWVYVVQTERGQETITPEEFAKKYGWKNDPERVS